MTFFDAKLSEQEVLDKYPQWVPEYVKAVHAWYQAVYGYKVLPEDVTPVTLFDKSKALYKKHYTVAYGYTKPLTTEAEMLFRKHDIQWVQ